MTSTLHRDRAKKKKQPDTASAMEAFAAKFEKVRQSSKIDAMIDGSSKKIEELHGLEHAVLCYANAYARSRISPPSPLKVMEDMVRDYASDNLDAEALLKEIRTVSNRCGIRGAKSR